MNPAPWQSTISPSAIELNFHSGVMPNTIFDHDDNLFQCFANTRASYAKVAGEFYLAKSWIFESVPGLDP